MRFWRQSSTCGLGVRGNTSVLPGPPWRGWPQGCYLVCHSLAGAPELFHVQRRARVCTAAQGVTCSLAGILKRCACLVCKYPSAQRTRRGSFSLSALRSESRPAALGSLQRRRGTALLAGHRFPPGKEPNAQSPSDVGVVSTTGYGATWGRNHKALYLFIFLVGKQRGYFWTGFVTAQALLAVPHSSV